ncbi:MAG: hypothetical protein M0Z40_18645 [Actinomycetota bacterium]|nr:hypothetical protein [Actinomycetota bacterium]
MPLVGYARVPTTAQGPVPRLDLLDVLDALDVLDVLGEIGCER